jgi:hypothetical protein
MRRFSRSKLDVMNEEEHLDPDIDDADDIRPELPAPDFDFLVYSLRLQAELNLGLLPFGDKQMPDFDLGRHNIDLLAMLQEKTKGNLTPDEQRSLDNSVTELRFRFVQARELHVPDAKASLSNDAKASVNNDTQASVGSERHPGA